LRLALLALPLAAVAQPSPDHYRNPVLAGDYPDPSIVRVGDEFWAVATSSDWGPQFPLLHSTDLVNWTVGEPVFPHRPGWAVGKFWAPEIVEHKGRFFVYYVAEKKDGPLSVAVASADKVQGPYLDHGPIVSQPDGSIDPVPADDVNGDRYLIWKEDGNSIGQPTPIFAQRLAADGVTLMGEPHELIRNTEEWEGPLVEAPYVKRHGDYLYMFYSANACCGNDCKYAVGVARARSMLGPWEKFPANPILAGNEKFRCPGHGSPVTDQQGRDYYFYHAVSRRDGVFVGRQAMLDRITWGQDGWPRINDGKGPSESAPLPFPGRLQQSSELSYSETFSGPLDHGWSWPQASEPSVETGPDGLRLAPGKDGPAGPPFGAVLGRPTVSGDYVAETTVLPGSTRAGLAAWGNRDNAIGLAAGKGTLLLWQIKDGKLIHTLHQPFQQEQARLRLTARDGDRYQFSVWCHGEWQPVGEEIQRDDLPPWDLGVRVALTASAAPGALFKSFSVTGVGR
jgi:beta-xylosidase